MDGKIKKTENPKTWNDLVWTTRLGGKVHNARVVLPSGGFVSIALGAGLNPTEYEICVFDAQGSMLLDSLLGGLTQDKTWVEIQALLGGEHV